MPNELRNFRKLGSTWRGIFVSSALFVDEHCLLLVRSTGYSEHVQRLYFKDIQAIVVSKSYQFGVSRPAALGAALVFLGFLVALALSAAIAKSLAALAGLLILIWLYVSMRASRRCRIYTGVSREELPSVRRQWSASRVVQELVARVEAAQGTLPEDWKETVPAEPPLMAAAEAALGSEPASVPAESRPGQKLASGALLLTLAADLLLTAWDLSRTQPLAAWIGSLLALIEAACAVWVLIQNRGLRPGLQRFGAAVLIFLGTAFYAQYGVMGAVQSQMKRSVDRTELHSMALYRGFLEVYIGICVVLFIIGAILVLAGKSSRRPQLLVE